MSNSKEVDKLKDFLYDFAQSLSYSEETSTNYLKENNVDVEKFIAKGLNQIEATLKKKGAKKSKALFFKRVVLAAEITHNLYGERTFGHVKLQKLMYLAEQVSNMKLSSRYTKQAAGPYDAKFMHTIDRELERLKWFNIEIKQGSKYNTYEYSLGEKVDSYKSYYYNYYSENLDSIRWLIETFGKHQTKKVELVATIYSCLEEFIKSKEDFTSDLLLQRVMDWSKEKRKKFTPKDVSNAHNWMIEKGLVPRS